MAQDETLKRQNMVRKAISQCTQLLAAMDNLTDLQTERSKLVLDFQAADLAPADLTHLTATQVGILFDFVLPTFQATLADAGNAGRNVQILNQMRSI